MGNTGGDLSAWGGFIRDLRAARNLTQDEFAQKVGVNRKTVMRWEAGAPTNDYDTVTRLADAFGLSSADLFKLLHDPGEVEIPPPLPRELAELVLTYQEMRDPVTRKKLLERVGWISEWAIAALARERSQRPDAPPSG